MVEQNVDNPVEDIQSAAGADNTPSNQSAGSSSAPATETENIETSGSADANRPPVGNASAAEQNVNDDLVKTPQFQHLTKSDTDIQAVSDVNRLKEVKVVVSAELGRTRLPIRELLSLTDGSVIELNRNVDAPIELMAQGVPLGNGEVVVVDEFFAIRIKEIYSNP